VQAQALMRERSALDAQVVAVRGIENALAEHQGMAEMAEAEGDADLLAESEDALIALQATARRAQLAAMLSGEADGCDAYLNINAGAGGTEAQDWAAMLARMYTRWAEARGHAVALLEESPGEEAGIKSCTLRLSGPQAYGWIKTETGVHRLVRISPFDAAGKRHTSFASVGATPVIDDSIEVCVEDKDLRIDTYRSQGAGGQHVNTTDSAVRITHIPTGIAVACQSERSQHQNRANAMAMLRARLYEAELQRREEAAAQERGEKSEIGWGHQIRSYVLAPYQMVKDLRTGVERTDPSAVLDGDIDAFLMAALAARAGGA
jgi:peptide chain release factor 2